MPEPTVFPGDVQIKGTLMPTTLSLPALTVTNAGVAAAAAIDASKLLHMVNVSLELFAAASTVTALTKEIYIAKGIGSITAIRAAVNGTIATGGDRTINVDLQKSTGGGAFATVLSATVLLNSSSTLRTLATGTISSATYAAGDLFRFVVTVAGAAGNQAAGLVASFVAYEATT